MSARDELHGLVNRLTDADAEAALELLHDLVAAREELTPDELKAMNAGEDELARGECVTLPKLRDRVAG